MRFPSPEQVRIHWTMLDCLFDEVYLGQHDDTLHGPEMLEELIRYFACHDPRFNAVGLSWNRKGFIQYRMGDDYQDYYAAEAAIAVFLGLGIKSNAHATYLSLPTIYKRFDNILEARIWIRWRVQRMYGFDNKARDLWTGYPRNFPQITHQNNELLAI
jgi:hypothetical protein